MISRIRERLMLALTRIEDRHTQFLYPPVEYDPNANHGDSFLNFIMMDETKLLVDQNIYPDEPRQHIISIVGMGPCHAHTYPDGMLVLFPSHCPIPRPQGFLPHTDLNVPLMLIGNIIPELRDDASSSSTRTISEALFRQTQPEPIILLRNLSYRRPSLELVSVEQVQLLHTNVCSHYSLVGPVKTTVDPAKLGIPWPTRRVYVPGFRWNSKLRNSECIINIMHMGKNGFHSWPAEESSESFIQFIKWVSQVDLRTDHPGWFVNVEDEMRALTMLARL